MESLIVGESLMLAMLGSAAFGKGDLSRVVPEVITMEMGTEADRIYFRSNDLICKTRKAYRLALSNIGKIQHEIEAPEFVEKIFTAKDQVMDQGRLVAEIKGISQKSKWVHVAKWSGTSCAFKPASRACRSAPYIIAVARCLRITGRRSDGALGVASQ